MKHLILTAALAAGIPAAAYATQTLKLTVNGMVCSFCAQGIEKRLSRLPQTEAVYVNLAQRIVAVQAKQGQELDAAKVRAEVKEAGYHVVKVETVDQTVSSLRDARSKK